MLVQLYYIIDPEILEEHRAIVNFLRYMLGEEEHTKIDELLEWMRSASNKKMLKIRETNELRKIKLRATKKRGAKSKFNKELPETMETTDPESLDNGETSNETGDVVTSRNSNITSLIKYTYGRLYYGEEILDEQEE